MKTAESLTTIDPIRKADIIGKVATRYAGRGDVTTARQLSRHLPFPFKNGALRAMANFGVQVSQIETATALVNESHVTTRSPALLTKTERA